MTTIATFPALEYLQSQPQWVCWKRKTRDNGTTAKEPYNPNTGRKSEPDNPATWASYERASEVIRKYPQDYDGIGYMFNGDVAGVDLDHCIDENGNIDPWAQGVLDRLASYAEKSPSSTGIHILVFGLLPEKLEKGIAKRPGTRRNIPGQRDSKAAIEMYCENRFFTVTGDHLAGTPVKIENRQEQLLALHTEYTASKTKQKDTSSNTQNADPLSDNELLEVAHNAKDGAKFAALWRGDTSEYQNDASRADAALCFMLAFYTGKDAGRMDSLFRRSGLYREKWDRATAGSTYGAITIEKAIAQCTNVYTGRRHNDHNANQQGEADEKNRPEVHLTGQLRKQVKDSLEVLQGINHPKPTLFMHWSYPSKVATDEENHPIIIQLDRAGIRNELTNAANFYVWKEKGGKLVGPYDAHPPKDLADQLLALSPGDWQLPPLKAIVKAPVLRPDFSILDTPGYDEATRLYYAPSPEMKKCKVPTNPTQADAIAAMKFLLSIFADFPFESDSDRDNAIALLFTSFVRYAVKNDIQMACIDANNAGTGKGLLTIIVSIASTGETTPPMAAKNNDDEWRKAILTKLLPSPSIVIIDNIRGVLESQALELILTGGGFSERILGQSKEATVKNEATWIATGNNLLIGGDLARRCYRIRLVSTTATPEERTDFTIPDLKQWMFDNRPEVVTAILTVARAWYVAGKPKPKNVPNLGTFTDWAKTIGGMLEFVGVTGFQQNRAELRSRNNEQAAEWETFLSAWYATFADTWIPIGDVVDKITKKDETAIQPPANILFEALPQYLKKALAEKPNSFAVSLAVQLGKRVQTVYGTDAFRIEKKTNTHTKVNHWRVLRGDAVGSTKRPQGEKSNSSHNTHTCDDNSAYGGDEFNPPQPTANENNSHSNGAYNHSSNHSTGSTTSFFEDEQKNGFAGGSKETSKKEASREFYDSFCSRLNHSLRLQNGEIMVGVPDDMSNEEYERIASIVAKYDAEIRAILEAR